jgi:L-ascorbate metabolism protein UlaG (beta-lactamase superfamily)
LRAAKRLLRLFGAGLLWLVVALCLAATVIPQFLDRIYYRGPATAHFTGQRYFNPDGEAPNPPRRSVSGMFWRAAFGDPDRPQWPDHVAVTPSKPSARVDGAGMRVTWVGHATVLVQTSGLNILTDPVWSDTVGPFGIGPRRVAAPGIRFEDLPVIDLVLVSHNHYDHLDLATLKRLWDRDRPVFVTGLGNDSLLRGAGIPLRNATTDCGRCAGVEALDWGATTLVESHAAERWADRPAGAAPVARVTVVRNHHWSSRWFQDRNRALWSAFVVDPPAGGSLFFAGDTGLGDGRWPGEARRAALGPIRLALLPIGAFRFEEGQMAADSHIGPRDAIRVWDALGRPQAVGIHWGMFRLSREGYRTPPDMLREMLRCAGSDPARFSGVGIGVPVSIAPAGNAPPRPDLKALAACWKRGDFDALR